MKMASEVAEKPSYWPGYDLITNNCETFATYLKTGIKHSAQASAALFNLICKAAAAVTASDVAALLRSHMIGLLPFESTIEQITETMPLALKQ